MTGTFASRAFFTRAAIFGTVATHVGRGAQMTEVMSSTSSALPLTGTATATGSGIFGIGDVGVGAVVGAGVAGAAVVAAATGVGDGAAWPVHAAARISVARAGKTRRIALCIGVPLLSEAGELPLPHDRVQQCGPAFLPDHIDGASERRADVLRIVDRTLRVPAERPRQQREVRRRVREIHA